MKLKDLLNRTSLSAINFSDDTLKINEEEGIIHNVSVCTKGEAKGHGIFLDQSFIEDLFSKGNINENGIKCRFGHPSSTNDSIGSLVGVFKNFKLSIDKSQVLADLHLSESAKKSPMGDLHSYVILLAKDHSTHFGTSIVVFNPVFYQYDENGLKKELHQVKDYDTKKSIYMALGEFEACDLVDTPAANPRGLFSNNSIKNIMSIKDSIRKFFNQDMNPEKKEEDGKKEPLKMGEPKIGNECKFTQDENDYLLPDGELLVTAGPLEGKIIILKAGLVEDIQETSDKENSEPNLSNESLSRLQSMPLIKQLHIINQNLQTQLDKKPAAAATTAVNDNDDEFRQGFSSPHLSRELKAISRFQIKK